MSVPEPIPWRVAARIIADILDGQASNLRIRVASGSPAKRDGRARMVAWMQSQGRQIRGWIMDPHKYQREPVDAAQLGYLAAYACGHYDARKELEAELTEDGRPGALEGFRHDQIADILDIL